MSKKEIIAIDTETHLFKPFEMAPRIVCLSYCDEVGSEVFRGATHSFLKTILHKAIKGETLIVGHYVAFDMSCILRSFPDLWELVFDAYDADGIVCTAIRERLLDIAIGEFRSHNEEEGRKKHGYSLADLAKRKLDKDVAKGEDTWRLRYGELEDVRFRDGRSRRFNIQSRTRRSAINFFQNRISIFVRADTNSRHSSTTRARTSRSNCSRHGES